MTTRSQGRGKRGGGWAAWGTLLLLSLAWSSDARALQVERVHPRPGTAGLARLDGPPTSILQPPPRPFPHLLIARTGGAARRPGNARWNPASSVPPSVLPASWVNRTNAMLASRTSEEWRAAFRSGSGDIQPYTVRTCVLRVDFAGDRPGSKTTGDGRFDLRPDSLAPELVVDPPPHDRDYVEAQMLALRRYYLAQTDGWLDIQWDIFPAENDSAYHIGDTFDYGPWIFSNSNPDVLQHAIDLVGDGLNEANRTDPEIDWSTYQAFIVIHAGSDYQSDLNQDSPWDIPSFNLYYDVGFPLPEGSDSVTVNLVMVVPETQTQDGFQGALNSVFAHEFGHQLGFWDLYDVYSGSPVVGCFSLMDSGTNLLAFVADPADTTQTIAVRGTIPPAIDPFHKVNYLPPEGVRLREPRDYLAADADSFMATLEPAELDNDFLYVPLNLAEYYLVENRAIDLNGDGRVILESDPETGVILGPVADSSAVQDTLAAREYDYLLEGEGALVWHVDLLAYAIGATQYGGINVFYGRPAVGLVEADGIRDIGNASNEFLGGPLDPFYVGGYNHFGPDTHPSTNTNDGTPSGIEITALDSLGTPGHRMRVRVATRQQPAGWPVAFVGVPSDGQVLAVDLGARGDRELLVASGANLLAFQQNGAPFHEQSESALFMHLPEVIEGAPSAEEDFPFRGGSGTLVAVTAGGVLWTADGAGSALAQWPVAGSIVASPPVIADSLVWIGCDDGVIRALVPAVGDPIRAEIEVGKEPVELLAAGRTAPDAPFRLLWMGAGGTLGSVAEGDHTGFSARRGAAPGAAAGPPASDAAPAGLLVLSQGAPEDLRALFAWRDGCVEWRSESGALLPGWPIRVPGPIAGSPIIADADADGVLETVVVEQDGTIHCFGWNGVEELNWPRSIWTEDETDRPPLPGGPRALDVTGDGVVELLVLRTDGLLYALDGTGEPRDGWPLSFGSTAFHGPDLIPRSGDAAPRLACGNWYDTLNDGSRVDAVSLVRVPHFLGGAPGSFPGPGVDQSSSRVYPRAWVPAPVGVPGNYTEGSLVFYPNPLRGDDLTIHCQLGEPADLRFDLFDLTGAKLASLEGRGDAGLNGTQITWNLSGIAPGLYHVRCRFEGEGWHKQLYRKLAVIR